MHFYRHVTLAPKLNSIANVVEAQDMMQILVLTTGGVSTPRPLIMMTG